MKKCLSILMPLYNEQTFVAEILSRVLAAPLPEDLEREVIVVDDCSTDNSAGIVANMAKHYPQIQLVRQPQNRGKGAAVRRAIDMAKGEYCVIQDADLEYDPHDWMRMLGPLMDGRADAVFGSRFATSQERRVLYFWHSFANKMLTLTCNVICDINLTDMETCYKMIRTSLLQSIPLRSDRFGIEPELTVKLAKRRARIYEVPVSYSGRTYEEGKKIGLPDAFDAFFTLLRFGMSGDVYKDRGQQILHVLSYAQRFNKWMLDVIEPFVGGRVMEFGAGIGNLTRTLCPSRELYIATDIDSENLSRLSNLLGHYPQLRVHEGDLGQPEQFKKFESQVDTTVCLNVLEHVKDDMKGLSTMREVLVPGGRAIVLVPEGKRLYGRIDEVAGHYRRYSKEELIGKMREAGFEVERVLAFNRISRPGWFVSTCLLKKDTLNPTQLKIFDSLVWLWRRIDNFLPWGPISLIAIGRKA
jgi:glycosyltransferase involved in cell wall biosynthesis